MTTLLVVFPYAQRFPELLTLQNFSFRELMHLMRLQPSCRLSAASSVVRQLLPQSCCLLFDFVFVDASPAK